MDSWYDSTPRARICIRPLKSQLAVALVQIADRGVKEARQTPAIFDSESACSRRTRAIQDRCARHQ
jgi:hypothetical protein